jgi:hypothetical protein
VRDALSTPPSRDEQQRRHAEKTYEGKAGRAMLVPVSAGSGTSVSRRLAAPRNGRPSSGGVGDGRPQPFDVVERRSRLADHEADEAPAAIGRRRDVQVRVCIDGRGEGVGGVVALVVAEADQGE